MGSLNRSLALALMGAFIPPQSHTALPGMARELSSGRPAKQKGQLRATKPKASGAAKLKRAAAKRRNINKHNRR